MSSGMEREGPKHISSVICVASLHLHSLKDICKIFKVGRNTVLKWIGQGAPIAVEADLETGKFRYSAEYNTLQSWRVSKGKGYE